ncbi:MAG: UDP-N-acetylmuramoyl-L-alanine--D-glutamate ligase [Gammaproteobacteria bacterium RIFCSPHIGHO2_12_FULL_45_12]|nr:MAG: UDP-N-acetylmuramoyl-L-alanine--D-glutamate ligase [Gammaproteobacteria bacterium RIFCSPHIGHO2_12_FULL_45_12]
MSHSELYVIVGLGVTGVSCAQFLASQGKPFAVVDSRLTPPQLAAFQAQYPAVTVALGDLDVPLLEQATHLILSPGVAQSEPAIARQAARGVPVMGDIELFAQAVKAPVIAITGTNAKSTVTTLVGEMAAYAGLAVQVGGNLGVPVLELLMKHPDAALFVLELSSFQLETTTSLKPRVATVLNVTPDHMNRYRDLSAYQAAKHRIYQQCEIAVCNRDDPLTDCERPDLLRKFTFTLGAPEKDEFGLLTKREGVWLAFQDQPLMRVTDLPVMGKHYQANALAAFALGYAFGLPFEAMIAVLKRFTGLPHRCQLVRERQGVRWYNDSKGTNVGATQAAIEGLGQVISGRLVLIAGGVGKDADFMPLVPVISQYVRHVVLIGEAARTLADVMGRHVPLSFANSMEEAVAQGEAHAEVGDSVLLSPACASFDMFRNYEDRGQVFTQIVNEL